MVRLVGPSETVRSLFRPWALDAAAVVTVFGGATALLFVLSLLYWLGDRRDVATVVSYAFVALGVVLVLKTLFGLPRPPAEVRAVPLSNDPYGFPSGHAVAAVVVYGGLAAVSERRGYLTVAGVGLAVTAIALSRVVIGVHYLGDVLAGAALGLVLLVALWRTVGRRPEIGFAIAAGVAAVAALLGAPEATLALGGSLGGVLGSLARPWKRPTPTATDRVVVAGIGLLVVLALEGVLDGLSGPILAVAGNAVLVAVILLVPLAWDATPRPAM